MIHHLPLPPSSNRTPEDIVPLVRCGYVDAPALLSVVPGIYMICNRSNNYFYVGSSVNLRQRWHQHLWYLKHNCHHNPRLQDAWIECGASSFEFLVMEFVESASDLMHREQAWIDSFDASNREDCYNYCALVGSQLGRKRSDETKRKLSEAHRGKKHSDESKQKMRLAKLGKKLSEEQKQAISERTKGQAGPQWTVEQKQRYRKLSKEQAIEIKTLRASGVELKPIALRFGIGTSTVVRIVKGEAYRGVEDE